MTKEEDDWLSDFLEAAQASARQSQATAEKDYTAKMKLFAARFERARAGDADGELENRLAAAEALAGQKDFDAAADAVDEAFVFAGGLLSASALAAGADEIAPPEESSEEVESAESPIVEPESAPVEEPAVDAESIAPDALFDEGSTAVDPSAEALPSEESGLPEFDESSASDAPAEPTAMEDADAESLPSDEAAMEDSLDRPLDPLETGETLLAEEAPPETVDEESPEKSDL